LEASLMLSSHVLMLLNVPVRNIVRHVQEVRTSRYSMLRQVFPGQEISYVSDGATNREGLHSVELTNGAYAVGKPISELDFDGCNVIFTGYRRDETMFTNPESDVLLMENDVVVIYGTPEDLEHAEAKILRG
jgi:CPA2 family monovalent cation:H+ antiporter-2